MIRPCQYAMMNSQALLAYGPVYGPETELQMVRADGLNLEASMCPGSTSSWLTAISE